MVGQYLLRAHTWRARMIPKPVMCFAGSFFLSSLYKLWYLEPRMMFQNVAFNLPSGIMISRSHYRNAICLHDLYFAFSLPDSIGLVLYTQKYAINCFYSRSCSYDSCWHRSDWIPCLFMLDRRYVCISARFLVTKLYGKGVDLPYPLEFGIHFGILLYAQ